ncbi:MULTISPECIES: signal peptidase II [Hallerella]|uniref:Lipoprotein signal peptidase n=1 Tax=Hallerella succinigenes TaxID=1896222 RepID=A0A2M9A4Y0_9BACT|nr:MULTISPECIES: signal peptidase II [Hallerella]MBS7392678.1 signal peptidase II [Fibrobacter sp.]MCI6873758.1 signal peptidase II [Hallerella sp.]MDY5028786.1 signal peptidase II [Hallerella succinigenes]PJJ40749.1 signal peptidase II [Hallerella succinigenes]
MSERFRLLKSWKFHLAFIFASIFVDQATKIWAVAYLEASEDFPTGRIVPVIGDLLQFRLAYNFGAAFSSRPQDLLPFLSPTVFFLVISLVAVVVLFSFYRSVKQGDFLVRTGIAMILSGALGNLADRVRIGKVVDFIDCDFPDFIMQRWPTFNFADCCVTVGVALVLISPVIYKWIAYNPAGSNAEENNEESLS